MMRAACSSRPKIATPNPVRYIRFTVGRVHARPLFPARGRRPMSDAVASTRKRVEARDSVVIRFAGDSGDGMQVTGMQFTTESALAGNDIATLPDFPAEIRAPAGT